MLLTTYATKVYWPRAQRGFLPYQEPPSRKITRPSRGEEMNDDADKKAAELLPCLVRCGTKKHYMTCPAAYREVVAAALKGKG